MIFQGLALFLISSWVGFVHKRNTYLKEQRKVFNQQLNGHCVEAKCRSILFRILSNPWRKMCSRYFVSRPWILPFLILKKIQTRLGFRVVSHCVKPSRISVSIKLQWAQDDVPIFQSTCPEPVSSTKVNVIILIDWPRNLSKTEQLLNITFLATSYSSLSHGARYERNKQGPSVSWKEALTWRSYGISPEQLLTGEAESNSRT